MGNKAKGKLITETREKADLHAVNGLTYMQLGEF